jgi:hypothetical protein
VTWRIGGQVRHNNVLQDTQKGHERFAVGAVQVCTVLTVNGTRVSVGNQITVMRNTAELSPAGPRAYNSNA